MMATLWKLRKITLSFIRVDEVSSAADTPTKYSVLSVPVLVPVSWVPRIFLQPFVAVGPPRSLS